jgi:hypothetical protein
MNKKIIILFLVMCIVGFSMSPVNAQDHNYYINGTVGDVFEFREYRTPTHPEGMDLGLAYQESGLFDISIYPGIESDGQRSYQYYCVAMKNGHRTVKFDQWDSDRFHDIYHFNIHEEE